LFFCFSTRAKVFVHKQKPGVIIAHRGTQAWADKWTDIAALAGGRRKQSARSNCDKSCASSPHITAVGHSLGGTHAQDTKGSNKQMAFNKATTLHDVLYKRMSQVDYRKTMVSFLPVSSPTLLAARSSQELDRLADW
jgi:hypothetical protein